MEFRLAPASADAPLHELRVSPSSLAALGAAASSAPLLLANQIPCWAVADADLADGAVAAPPWMLQHLNLAEGDAISLVLLDTPTLLPARRVELIQTATTPWVKSMLLPGVRLLGGDVASPMHPLGDEDGAAALRRQLEALPLRRGALCAVDRLTGVLVLRVERVDDADDDAWRLVGAETAVLATSPPPWPPKSAAQTPPPPPEGVHGAALERALWAHAHARLRAPAADESDAARQLRLAARGGGHVLVCGPPGVGKKRAALRLAARLVAEEHVRAHRVLVPELLCDGEEAATRVLTAVFADAAQRSPAVVVLDMLEIVCEGTEPAALGGSADDARAPFAWFAAALLAQLRATPPRVLVVGTCWESRRLPRSLLAHGGFEALLPLPPPTARQRETLLLPLLRPHAAAAAAAAAPAPADDGRAALIDAAEAAERLAQRTAGFSVRDLRGLVLRAETFAAARAADAADAAGTSREAQIAALDAVVARGHRPALALDWDDVEGALAEATPSAVGRFDSRGPYVGWDQVGGCAEAVRRLRRLVETLQRHTLGTPLPGGIAPPSGVLLYGPPGCGKTLIAQALASTSGCAVLAASGAQLFGAYVGETEEAIRELFRQAAEAAPALVFIDEIDHLGASRDADADGGGGGVHARALSTLLNELDGVGERGGFAIVGCTNRPELVDAALLRPGRLEQLVLIGPPDEADRLAALRVHAKDRPLADDVSLDELAGRTPRYSRAALAALCREAAVQAMTRHFRATGRLPPEAGEEEEDDDDDDDESEEEDEGEGEAEVDPEWVALVAAEAAAAGLSLDQLEVTREDWAVALREMSIEQGLPPVELPAEPPPPPARKPRRERPAALGDLAAADAEADGVFITRDDFEAALRVVGAEQVLPPDEHERMLERFRAWGDPSRA